MLSNQNWIALTFAGMLFIPCMPATGLTAYAHEPTRCADPRRCSQPVLPGIVDMERARRNYLAVARGYRSLNQLSPLESQEVLALIRQIEANRLNGSDPYERCREQQLGGRTHPSELELSLVELKCAMR